MARTELPLVAPRSPTGWVELALDYRCNLRCIGCHACHDTGESLSTDAAVQALRDARRRGSTRLWLGGGEPTLRSDLLGLVRAARSLGFADVLLQTNGMRLAYADYRDAALAAGVTEVRFNVKSHRAEVHDALSHAPCHELLLTAIAGLAGKVTTTADVLLTCSSLADLPGLVPFFAERGITRFVLWLLSVADSNEADVAAEVPSFHAIVPALREAASHAARLGVTFESLHTPPCTLPGDLRHVFLPASSLGLTVVGPDGRSFPLEASSFEGGTFVAACGECRERPHCLGLRADYLRIHGAADIAPLPPLLDSTP